jgi:hypothetical protein
VAAGLKCVWDAPRRVFAACEAAFVVSAILSGRAHRAEVAADVLSPAIYNVSGRFNCPSGEGDKLQMPADRPSKAADTVSAANYPPSESGISLSERRHCSKNDSYHPSNRADIVSGGRYPLSKAADALSDRVSGA